MLITVVCPTCQSKYQVQPTLRGKSVRCPNEKCRKVFAVPNGEEEKPTRLERPTPEARRPTPAKPQRSGAVGDMVPMLPAEASPPPKPTVANRPAAKREAPKEAPSWLDAPPPISPAAKSPIAPPPKRREAASEPEAESGPKEIRWGDAPPPARRNPEGFVPIEGLDDMPPAEEPPAEEYVPEEIEPESVSEYLPPPRRGKGKAYAIVAALLVLVVAGLAVGGLYVWRTKQAQKDERFQDALDEYKKGGFRASADKFHDLLQAMPNFERKDECLFYEALGNLRADLEAPPAADTDAPVRAQESLKRIGDFIDEHKAKPVLSENGRGLGETLVKVVGYYTKEAATVSNADPLAVVDKAAAVKEQVGNLKDGLSEEDSATIDAELTKVRSAVATWQRHEDVINQLRVLVAIPSSDAIKTLQKFVRLQEDAFPGLGQESAVVDMKSKLYDGHFASVTFQEDGTVLKPPEAIEPPPPALAVTPFVPGQAVPAGQGLDLFMARGVLYALERGTGQFRWATRVGLDGVIVPLRLGLSTAGRERFLILSDDGNVVQVVDDGGAVAWRYRLSKPCLGKPLLVDQRVLLPTLDGLVYVFDLASNRLQGTYRLGQRLSVGGVRQEGTRLVYFPADDTCVYILDVNKHHCVGILYTGHAAGSLRSEPLIVTPETATRGTPGGFLILNQTAGVDESKLSVFALPTAFPPPMTERVATPLKLENDPRLRGWTWFAPHADDEKIAMVTDAGRLAIFGVKQAENNDPVLFPLLPMEPGGLRLDLLLPPEGAGRGRAQVVFARGEDLWVMANGKLQRLQLGWRGTAGRTLLKGWRKPLDLGLLLHAGQVAEDSVTDRALLMMTTQPAGQQVCLATAIDEDTGSIHWQRQLGMVCRGEPLLLGAADDPAPLMLAIDHAGGLFLFDTLQYSKLSPGLAQSGGVRLAGSVDDNPFVPPLLLPGLDDRSAYEIASPGRGKSVILVRQVRRDPTDRRVKLEGEPLLTLPAPLGGTPAIVGSRLLLPLENGTLVFVKLPLDGSEPKRATNWRDAKVGTGARGTVVPLSHDKFLTTDGHLGITHWTWPDSSPLPKGKANKKGTIVPVTYELAAPLAAAPVMLPPEKDLPLRVCVADMEGNVTLLNVLPDGAMNLDRSWELRGRITGGPFLRFAPDKTARIGCVVDDRRLVWLDPSRDGKPAWEYPAEADIVGQPQIIEDLLIVALRSGALIGIDPATGTPKGEQVWAPSGVSPAISPVPFGPGRVFAPLADGTIMLPERKRFEEAAPPR